MTLSQDLNLTNKRNVAVASHNMPGRSDGGNTRQITESDLEDLRNKFHLLEGDRKAYYEMSMHTMKSNKSLVAQLRAENKEVRRALASIQRERAASSKAGSSVDEEEEHEMEREVNRLRKMCDQYTNKAAGTFFLWIKKPKTNYKCIAKKPSVD